MIGAQFSLKKFVFWYGVFAISVSAGILYWIASMK